MSEVWSTDEVSPPQTALAPSALRATWRALQFKVMGLRLSVDTAWWLAFAFLAPAQLVISLGEYGLVQFEPT